MEIREHYPGTQTHHELQHHSHAALRPPRAGQAKRRSKQISRDLQESRVDALLQFINLVAGHFSTDLGYSQPACHTFCSLANLFRTAFKPVHSSEPDSPPAQAVGTRVPESALRALGGRSQFSLAVAKHESLPVIRKEPRQPAASPKAYPSPPHI